jgi:glycosyltransferase involved in cell wall biosynthesis
LAGFVFNIRSRVKNNDMKGCFIVGTLGRGGAEKQLVYMLRALQQNEISVRVLCLTEGESYEAEIRSLGIDVEYVGDNKNRGLRLIKIIRNLRNRPADIIQSSHFYTNIYTAIAGKVLRIPSIGAIRSDLKSEIEQHGRLGKYQLSLPSLLIANSNIARRSAMKLGISRNKIEFLRNVVETPIEKPEIFTSPSKEFTFLFVGRLSKEKRADRFIRMADALVKKFPELPLRFKIAGDGIFRDVLEKQVADCVSLNNKFEFLGECVDIDKIYKRANALVLTSEYEGTPNVVLEALSHALPVIATNVGGIPEILNGNRGILVNPNDENELTSAATKLIENNDLRNSLRIEGFEYIKHNHSLKNLSNHLREIYNNLINPIKYELDVKPTLRGKIASR